MRIHVFMNKGMTALGSFFLQSQFPYESVRNKLEIKKDKKKQKKNAHENMSYISS